MTSSESRGAAAMTTGSPTPDGSVVHRLRQRLRTWRALQRASREWPRPSASRSAKHVHATPAPRAVSRLLFIPSDLRTLIGARGDEAMLRAVADRLRRVQPDLKVAVLTSSDEADRAARSLNFEPIRMPGDSIDVARTIPRAMQFNPDAAVLIGADMMDGHYSPVLTARLLLLTETLASRGVRTAVTGFSFNGDPHGSLRSFFDRVSGSVQLAVRDPVSHRRFKSFSRANAALVADVAFLLQPDHDADETRRIGEWVRQERARGRVVLGLNAHPGLVRGTNATEEAEGLLVRRLAEAAIALSASRKVSWLLLAHDYRQRGADAKTLAPLAAELEHARPAVPFLFPGEELSAPQLKAIASTLDGVVTGRMHLAIAATGMGVPVSCLTYQGKFEGLFEHFEFPQRYLMAPPVALQVGALESMLGQFVDELATLRGTASRRLPEVLRKSELNLAGLINA